MSFCDSLFGVHGECWKNFLLILHFGVMTSPSNAFLSFSTGWGGGKRMRICLCWSKDHRPRARSSVLRRGANPCLQAPEAAAVGDSWGSG